jgi:uncharacterized protein YkwD
MKAHFLFFLFLLPLFLFAQDRVNSKASTIECLSETELQLATLINAYRAEKRLPAIELSASLCHVAHTHCLDLAESNAYTGKCNLHSWSGNGKWTSCCYTPDHVHAACMWNKPRELTSYKGDGFEIAYFTTAVFESPSAYAKEILRSWKGSPGHNEIIINEGKWDNMDWKAMGVGIWQGYATVWFGTILDPAGKPEICN